jgi:DNA modification methylase
MYKLYNIDNLTFEHDNQFDYLYCDMIYENLDLSWIDYYWKFLKEGGIFCVQTDFHSVFEVGCKMKTLSNAKFINHLAYKCEWGNHPKDRFHQCFDDIIIFSKGKHKKFDSSVIQVPKATANTKLNPSGRETKTATAFIDDICLTTTSKERVKKADGHLIRWQKPIRLFDRIVAPFTDEGDDILDNYMGSGSLAEWAILNNRNYVGIEYDTEVYNLAKERIKKYNV